MPTPLRAALRSLAVLVLAAGVAAACADGKSSASMPARPRPARPR